MGNISQHLSVFVPDETKVMDLAHKLQNGRLYLSDEHRNEETISAIILSHLCGESFFIEIGDWQGLFGIANVVRGWKADLFFKLWDDSIWGPDLRRELGEAIDKMVKDFGLERIALSTPDEHTAKMARFYGFEQEGLFKNSFKWDGVPYDTLCLALNRRT